MLRAALALAGGLLALLLVPILAAAGETVVCSPTSGICYVVVEKDGTPGSAQVSDNSGSSGSTGETPACRSQLTGETIDCYSEAFGWWSNERNCYFRLVDPQPPPDNPVWEGNHPNGAIYMAVCPMPVPGTGGGWTWEPTPPPGFGGVTVTPEQLAAQAVEQLPLNGPAIGIVPEPGKTGLVGLPVWLWTEETPSTWGPVSATASIPGMSVTATARVRQIEWSMGDGSVIVCTSSGTPYTPARGAEPSPDCGHTYTVASVGQPGEAYPITATATWEITWSGGGAAGQLEQTRQSTAQARIGELQVLVS